MAKIGTFGNVVFTVSDKTVKTFNDMSWKVSGNWATHNRHMQNDLLEFIGPEPDTMSFSMVLSVFFGVNPLKELKKLQSMAKDGEINRLVLGGKVYGSYKWAVTSVSADLQRFDKKGNCWAVKATIGLKEYAMR